MVLVLQQTKTTIWTDRPRKKKSKQNTQTFIKFVIKVLSTIKLNEQMATTTTLKIIIT